MSDSSSPVWGWIIADRLPGGWIDLLKRQLEDQEELIETLTARLAFLLLSGRPMLEGIAAAEESAQPPVGSLILDGTGLTYVSVPAMAFAWAASGGWWLTGSGYSTDAWSDLFEEEPLWLLFSPGWLR